MANPVASIGVSGDSSYTAPTFGGYMQAGSALGQALSGMGDRMRAEKERQRQLQEQQRQQQQAQQLFSGFGQAAQTGGQEGALQYLLQNPQMAGDDSVKAIMEHLVPPEPEPLPYETVDNPFGRGGVGQKDPRTGKIENYQKPEGPTNLQKEFEYAQSLGFEGTPLDFMKAKRSRTDISVINEGEKKGPGMYHPVYGDPPADHVWDVDPDTNEYGIDEQTGMARVVPIAGGPKDKRTNPTEMQGKAIAYLERAVNSLPALTKNFGEGASIKGKILDRFEPLGANFLQSPEYQQYKQATVDFMLPVIRFDTGAAIAEHEMDQYLPAYLPQPGDSEGTRAQKFGSVLSAIRGMERSAGQAAKGVMPEGFEEELRALYFAEGAQTPNQFPTAEAAQPATAPPVNEIPTDSPLWEEQPAQPTGSKAADDMLNYIKQNDLDAEEVLGIVEEQFSDIMALEPQQFQSVAEQLAARPDTPATLQMMLHQRGVELGLWDDF